MAFKPVLFQFFCSGLSGKNDTKALRVSNVHMHAFIDF